MTLQSRIATAAMSREIFLVVGNTGLFSRHHSAVSQWPVSSGWYLGGQPLRGKCPLVEIEVEIEGATCGDSTTISQPRGQLSSGKRASCRVIATLWGQSHQDSNGGEAADH